MKIKKILSVIIAFCLFGCSSIQLEPVPTFTSIPTNTIYPTETANLLPTLTALPENIAQITATSKDNQIILKGFKGYVFWLAWSEDGKRLFIGTEKSGLVVYDIVNKKVIANFENNLESGSVMQDLALSPDKKTLAIVIYNEHSIRLVNPETGDLIKILDTADYWSHGLSFSPDSKVLASSRNDRLHEIILWDIATGKEIKRLSNDNYFGRFSFNPNGNSFMAATGENTFTVWETDIWKLQRIIQCECSSWFYFSPDGNKFTTKGTGIDKEIGVWDFKYGKKLLNLSGVQLWAYAMAYSPSGKYIAIGDGDGNSDKTIDTITIWDTNTGEQVRKIVT